MPRPKEPEHMTIRCPGCDRFMMEIGDYGRAVCANCGVEVTVKTKGARQPA